MVLHLQFWLPLLHCNRNCTDFVFCESADLTYQFQEGIQEVVSLFANSLRFSLQTIMSSTNRDRSACIFFLICMHFLSFSFLIGMAGICSTVLNNCGRVNIPTYVSSLGEALTLASLGLALAVVLQMLAIKTKTSPLFLTC